MIKHIRGDVTHDSEIVEAMQGIDHVYAMAGLLGTSELYATPQLAIRVNIEGITNILEAAVRNNVKRIFFPATPYIWKNLYSITKRCAEELFRAYHLAYEIDIRVLRLWNVYGCHQKWEPVKKVVPEFCIRALANLPLEIYGDDTNRLFLMHVRDATDLTIMFMHDSGKHSETYDTKTLCHSCSVADLAKTIITLAKSESQIVFLPKRMGEFQGEDCVSSVNIADILSVNTSRIDLIEGLKSTLQYYAGVLPDYRRRQVGV